ncbi:SpoVR family protein [Pirellula staleyi DSM 6068]|uniref:SpoVR family protein n=1 Tax=Pirellula staleyi (strain ATCC 27377 / DSM 6068 / ICPB 4128) TaxID=530564 RepID=D2R2R2_PIRSD|nr:SpoVR family protein [Pirellula staleyi]ADB16902.1 SpoVR family protein [Pirellula staleyi DSM 6068]
MQSLHRFRSLTPQLVEVQRQMEEHARNYGLDFFTTIFEVVDADQLNAIAAYGGFPTRYPHWRFGMEYEQLSKGYSYGLQKIYELVINNDPCYAYLLASNMMTDHKLVMAHVYGHCDFFKNNEWFSKTNRRMIDEMANHGNRIRDYMDRYGVEEVETFIDSCLTIEWLIDIYSPHIKRRSTVLQSSMMAEQEEVAGPTATRFQSKSYMDSFVNPPAAMHEEMEQKRRDLERKESFPSEPMRDVMLFLLEHAPLKPWQHDVLAIIRDEAYYFAPQAQTKIMNEGWATYWHSTIMTRHGIEPADLVCYADHCSGTLAGSRTRLNPYKLGLELFRDIEDRWNRGAFGEDFDACDDYREKKHWDKKLGLGRKKIFEVRKVHNDLTFIDEFLTLDFCREHKLFSFGMNKESGYYEIESRQFAEVKKTLLFNLTNIGRPIIYVKDGNYRNRGELYLEHRYSGVELDTKYAQDTLTNLHRLWKRPVHIETVTSDVVTVHSFDGREHASTSTKK